MSKKAGVLATIVLDRSSGAILNTTGSIPLSRASKATNISDEVNGSGDLGGVERMGAMVWNFVKAAGGLVEDLDAEVIQFNPPTGTTRLTEITRMR